jgi:small-conductance mechanosensitive channel
MPAVQEDDLIPGLDSFLARIVSGLEARFAALADVPGELAELRVALAAQSTSAFLLGLQIVLVTAIAAGAFLLIDRLLLRARRTNGAYGLLAAIIAATVALAAGLAAAHLLGGPAPVQRTLRLWVVVTVTGGILMNVLRLVLLSSVPPKARNHPIHRVQMARHLSFVLGLAVVCLALIATLRLWDTGPATVDLIGTGIVGLPTISLMAGAVWMHRRTMAAAVAGPRPRSRWRNHFARAWPAIVIGLLIFTMVNIQIAKTLGEALPGVEVLLTALIVLMTPHLDAMIWTWAQRGLKSPGISPVAAALRQTARFVVVIIVLALLGMIWATPLAAVFGVDLRLVASGAFRMSLILLIATFAWNVVVAMIDRISQAESLRTVRGDKAEGAPHSRGVTLVPLLGAIGKSIIVTVTVLSALAILDVNVWPLLTGLSFFGLALSFGSQALVKDVVSGLLFLVDDAFRFGEYIETPDAKGTVEKISIRSVSLRDASGSIATVPYGQISKIQNFSRGWVIEKFAFRLAFETDVEQVRELFRVIGKDIAADPEFGADLLEPFASQGIADVQDGSLIVQAAFTAKPGKQAKIRRAVLKAVHRAFRDNGIRVVPKQQAEFEENPIQ